MSESYVVAVKPSARRASASAGRHVRDRGPFRQFDSRAAAEKWASDASGDDATVYVRDANPGDEAVDGYLMAVRWGPDPPDESPGDQSALLQFRDDPEWQPSVQFFDEQ